jgi:RimJ/RimL family protein N-acetyltransferase
MSRATHSAIPGAIAIRRLEGGAAELRELQRVLEEAPDYSLRVTGLPPGNADAQSVFTALPEGKTHADKFVFAIYRDREMVGCADLIRGYPQPATAMLGLLLLSERQQRRGMGRRAYCLLEEIVRSWGRCERVRLGVVRTNEQVIPFWTGLGFTPTGEARPYRHGSVASEVLVFEKPLPTARLKAT